MPGRRDERREPIPNTSGNGNMRYEEERMCNYRNNAQDATIRQQQMPSPRSDVRIPGPFWIRQRPDERREVDIPRKKRFERRDSLVQNIVEGDGEGGRPEVRRREEGRFRERQCARETHKSANPYDLPPGPSHTDPFWYQERPDERREPEIDRKKKFGHERIEAAEVIHGEYFREGPREKNDSRLPAGAEDDSDNEDQSEPFPFKRACHCARGPPPSAQYTRDARKRENDSYVPEDVEATIRQQPEARLSCAPASEMSKFDQPNTFMKKLYEKYPYLYQVLKETPPEELVSKVFKDRFLSTYQVDYLHMGMGKDAYPGGGRERDEIITGPEGEPEPQIIPGCSYRYNKKGDFGRKKAVYEKKEVEDEVVQVEKEEPRISEYMATISKLGGEIVSDQLYKVAQMTKNMKNQYNNL